MTGKTTTWRRATGPSHDVPAIGEGNVHDIAAAAVLVADAEHGTPKTAPLLRADAEPPGDHGLGGSGTGGAGAVKAPDERRQRSFLYKSFRMVVQAALPVAILFAAISGYKWFIATKPEVAKRPAVERAFAATTTTAQLGTYTPQLRLYGTTVAGRQVEIRALVAGRVVKTSDALRDGGQIDKGATIIEIDQFDYKSARDEIEAQLAEARAKLREQQASREADKTSLAYAEEQLTLSRTDLDRAVPLARRGAVSNRTVDDRRQALLTRRQAADQLKNSVRVWDARLAQQEATIKRLETGLERAKRRVFETTLTAPFNAYVTEVGAQVGRMVSANDKVATLIDRDWIEVRVTLTDAQYGRLIAGKSDLVGREVEIIWNIGRAPVTYKARIDRVAAKVTSDSGGVEIFARVAQPLKPVPLRPGAFVAVKLEDATYADVFRLPDTALYGRDTVYVVVNQRLQPRKIEMLGSHGPTILVRGDLRNGEQVLSSRLSTPGKGVKVIEEGTGRPKKPQGKGDVDG